MTTSQQYRSQRRHLCRLALLAPAMPLLAACAAQPAPPAAVSSSPTAARGQGGLIIGDPAAILAALPAAAARPPAPERPAEAVLAAWQEPISAWVGIQLQAVVAHADRPTFVARALALLAVGLADALLVVDVARAQGMALSEDTVLAEAARQILSATAPLQQAHVHAQADIARWVGVWRRGDDPRTVEPSYRLGMQIGAAVRQYAATDGPAISADAFALPAPAPGVWQPTAPDRAWPLDPLWGEVKPLGIAAVAPYLAPPPPAWASAAFVADRAAFAAAQARLSDGERALAQQWALGKGTLTPPGFWMQEGQRAVVAAQLPTREAARVYRLLGATLHNVVVGCWASKYRHMVARPIQWMRETDVDWTPVIVTPPHPSYPSGHAAISAAAAHILGGLFPQQAAAWQQMAADAARSRVLGGIHWGLDAEAGLVEGRQIAQATRQGIGP